MSKIELVDVSIRDGNQSLWGATGLNTAQTLAIAPTIARVGFKAIDFTSSTHMAVAVRYHREDPWERIRLMKKAVPDAPLQFITTGFRFISWETADSDFLRLAYTRLVANGISRVVILDPMHDMDALLAAAKMLREAGMKEIMGALTYTISEVHDDAYYAGLTATMAKSPDIDLVYLKDPAGILTPERARTLIPAIQAKLGGMKLELHSHCTIGLSALTYMMAADMGLDALHVAIGPLANGSSLPSASRVVANLRELGHSVDIDARALGLAGNYFTRLAAAEGLPAGAPQDFDASYLRHQVAGGVITTTKRQLAELKLEHRWPEVMEEVPRVRAELGYPIMVTPFPQIVCTQALFNVIGRERYGNIPDEVIRYAIERFGRPTAPIDPNVRDRIMALPRTKELLAEPPPLPLKERRRQFSPGMSDDEFILRAVMPAAQVDAMMAHRRERHYNPDTRALLTLLKEIASRPAVSQIVVEKPDFRLEVKSRSTKKTVAHG